MIFAIAEIMLFNEHVLPDVFNLFFCKTGMGSNASGVGIRSMRCDFGIVPFSMCGLPP